MRPSVHIIQHSLLRLGLDLPPSAASLLGHVRLFSLHHALSHFQHDYNLSPLWPWVDHLADGAKALAYYLIVEHMLLAYNPSC